ncbi:Uncharacterised protein [Streptococcus suis]|nr:Uncharacterised protein [Streptococcus suis]
MILFGMKRHASQTVAILQELTKLNINMNPVNISPMFITEVTMEV